MAQPSGHRPRQTSATSAAANGATAERLMGHLRHAKYETSAKYVRQVNRFANNVAAAAGI